MDVVLKDAGRCEARVMVLQLVLPRVYQVCCV